MKTAGIITYWDTNDNYGTVLQNYAVQEICKKYDIEPVLLRVNFLKSYSLRERLLGSISANGIMYTVKKFAEVLFRILYSRLCNLLNSKRKFDEFCSQYKNQTEKIYCSLKELEENISAKDIYIVGSDQIWNVSFLSAFDFRMKDYMRMIFLDFAPDSAKRIACAVSFGTNVFNPFCKEVAIKLLNKFDFVSLREKSGIKICKELGYENCWQDCDPTMLLEKTDYEKLFDDTCISPKRKYVLLYMLNNPSEFSLRKFYTWAKNRNLDVVYINGNTILPKINFRKKTYATIPQWIQFIKSAECVFTNSFHGTVFSLLFGKQFLSVLQSKHFANQNERIYSLLDDFGLNERFFSDAEGFDKVFEPIDFEKVTPILSKRRESSEFKIYLKNLSENDSVDFSVEKQQFFMSDSGSRII